jgi:hypothetical protein
MWKLAVNAFRVVLVSAFCLALGGTSAFAASPSAGGVVGNDVSWPQCGKTLPSGQAFGIVGVIGGLANNTNPCFATELA